MVVIERKGLGGLWVVGNVWDRSVRYGKVQNGENGHFSNINNTQLQFKLKFVCSLVRLKIFDMKVA